MGTPEDRPPYILLFDGVPYQRISPPADDEHEAHGITVVPAGQLDQLRIDRDLWKHTAEFWRDVAARRLRAGQKTP